MHIIKSDGRKQQFSPNKILKRIKDQSKGLNVNSVEVFQECVKGVLEGMSSTEIDNLIALAAASKIIEDPDYSYLASRIIITRHGKMIGVDPIDSDFNYDFFAISSFLFKYSLRNEKGEPIELPHMMYKRVAKHLGMPKLYNDLRHKNISLATPILINSGNNSGNLISCFKEGTQVYTSKGNKNIEDIKEGELVITHKNRFKKVSNIFKNPVGKRKLKNLKIYRTDQITCTENHEFLSYTSEDKRLGLEPSFKPLKWLRVGDFIKGIKSEENLKEDLKIDMSSHLEYLKDNWQLFRSTKISNVVGLEIEEDEKFWYIRAQYKNKKGHITRGKVTKLVKVLNIDSKLCKFIGIYYGDGHIQKSSKAGYQGIGITSKQNNKELEDFILEVSEEYFGITPKFYNQSYEDRSWSKLMIHSKPLAIIWKKLFGSHFDKKHIPDFFHSLNEDCIKNLIYGLISSDGTITKKGQVRVCLANKNLIKSFQILARKFNMPVGISKTTFIENRKQQYRLDFGYDPDIVRNVIKMYPDDRLKNARKNKHTPSLIEINGDDYFRIMDIQNEGTEYKYVYDIEVEEDHSYCVEGVVVHNCNITFLENDSTEGILSTLDDISLSSRNGAGIGLHIHNLRSRHTNVSSFNGKAGGVVRFADMVQGHMRFFKQGNRSGSAALYLGLWHRDIHEFLELRLPIGDEKMRTRDVFTAVCIPDLFMEKLNSGDDDWYLFCPHEVKKAGFKNLYKTHGKEFKTLYNKLVNSGIGHKTSVKQLWSMILQSLVKSGLPYVWYWDNANKNNPQDNIGIRTGSNLCNEYIAVTKPGYTPQCCLGLVCLHNLEKDDFKEVKRRTSILTTALNKVIDVNQWSTKGAEKAGKEQRTIGIGIAGLADYLAQYRTPFESEEALIFNEKLLDTIYSSAKNTSSKLASNVYKENYLSYKGSIYDKENTPMSNSLLVCLMPSASTSVLIGCNESFEPFQSNIFVRRIDAAEFIVVNKHLVRDLKSLDMWDKETIAEIIDNEGSIQTLKVPENLKNTYKTIWEIKQKSLIDLAGARQKNVDQGQSMNLYFTNPTTGKIGGALNYAWQSGLPSGVYYTKTRSKLQSPKRLSQEKIKTSTTLSNGFQIDCFGCSA